MNNSTALGGILGQPSPAMCTARGLSIQDDEKGYGAIGPEKTEQENRQEDINSLPVQRELDEEEKQELETYKSLLAQLLATADNPPTEKQLRDIKEVEKKIENLTGVKMSKSMSLVMQQLPGSEKENEQDKELKETLIAEPESLREMRNAEFTLHDKSLPGKGGTMSQFLRNWAVRSYRLSSLPHMPASGMKSITV